MMVDDDADKHFVRTGDVDDDDVSLHERTRRFEFQHSMLIVNLIVAGDITYLVKITLAIVTTD